MILKGYLMRTLGITLAVLFLSNMATAGIINSNFGGGGRGMDDGYYNGAYQGGYNNPGNFGGYGQTGENTGNVGFLSCACAMRIKLNNTAQDPACDNYSRMHQNMIINPGSVAPGTAPANPQMFHI